MEQIRQDQVVPSKVPNNTVLPIPRDLGQVFGAGRTKKLGLILPDGTPNVDGSPGSIVQPGDSIENINKPSTIPGTPSLIAIKSQTINIKPDGTAVVDVILDIENIKNATDYEVRVSKGEGNL